MMVLVRAKLTTSSQRNEGRRSIGGRAARQRADFLVWVALWRLSGEEMTSSVESEGREKCAERPARDKLSESGR